MKVKLKRWLMLMIGWSFILLGIAGLFLPILQGVLFLITGLVILSSEYVWAHRLLERLKGRFPALAKKAHSAHEAIRQRLHRHDGPPRSKVLVLGAGVIGSICASRLQEAGHEVTILARGTRKAVLEQHGLILHNEMTGEEVFTRPRITDHVGTDDAYDWIFVAVRAGQLALVLRLLATNHTPNVVFMVDHAPGTVEWTSVVGDERVVFGFPNFGGSMDGAIVRFSVAPRFLQATTIGEIDGYITQRLRQLAHLLDGAGFAVEISRDIPSWQKTHLGLVLPLTWGLYAADGDSEALAQSPRLQRLIVAAVRENLAALRAAGVRITPKRVQVLSHVPSALLVRMLRRWMMSRYFRLVAAEHAMATVAEMLHLREEFKAAVTSASAVTPANDALDELVASQHEHAMAVRLGHTG